VITWVEAEVNVRNSDKHLKNLNVQLLRDQEVVIPHAVGVLERSRRGGPSWCVDVQDVVSSDEQDLLDIETGSLV